MASKTTVSFIKLTQKLVAKVLGHFSNYLFVFYPVREKEVPQNDANRKEKNLENIKIVDNRTHLFPLTLLAYIYLDTLVQFAANNFHYDPRGMPTLFTHRIGPQVCWPITDVVLIFGLWMPTMTFLCLYCDKMVKYQKCMLLIDYRKVGARDGAPEITQNGKILSSQECTKIADYHRLVKKALPLVAAVIYSFLSAFCLSSFSQHWSGSLHDYVMFAVTVPFLYHATISNCMLMGLFCITTVFLAIRQRLMMSQSSTFLSQLFDIYKDTKRGGSLSRKKRNFDQVGSSRQTVKFTYSLSMLQLWRSFRWLNLDLAALCKHINGQNSFWSKYLTIYFFGYTIFSVYFLYVYFFYLEDHAATSISIGWMRHFFSCFGLEYAALLLFVTWQCSKMAQRNVLLHQNLTTFERRLQDAGMLFTLKDRFRSDQLAADRKHIEKVSFTLSTGYSINSKMFEMLFSYINFIFMIVFKDNHKK